MSQRNNTPPPRRGMAQPRVQACNYVASNPFTAILQELSGAFHGSLRKPSAQIDPNIMHLSVSCDMPNINSLGLAFPSSMTLRAAIPFISNTKPGQLDTHTVTVKIFAGGFKKLIVHRVEDTTTLPPFITQMPDYVEGRTQLHQIKMELNADGIICDGLHIKSPFPDTAALNMMDALKSVFDWDHMALKMWVLSDRKTPFGGPIDRLVYRHEKDIEDKFYEKYYIERPFASFMEIKKVEDRPVALYQPSLPVSLNLTEFGTKYSMGVIELNEFQQASANQFNETLFEMKVFAFGSGSTEVYLAILKPQNEITLSPREGEKLTIKFEQDGMPGNEQWQAKVLAPIKHYLSSYISVHLNRPRQAHPPETPVYVREHEILDFVETDIGSGQLEELDDEELFEEVLKNTPTFTVKAKVQLSETTAKRQVFAIEALQRGQRYNIKKRPHDLTYLPWTDDKEIQAFGKFILLQDSVPKSRTNWLGHGIDHVQHLTDADQLDAIKNLFCNAPSPVGILVGPAGTGKTVFMSTMIMAHVLAYDSHHVVGSPSNVGAEVAALKIQSMFKADPRLKGKIIMRAYHDASDAGNSSQNRSQPDQGASTDVGVYSADGWYNQQEVEGKRAMKELVKVIQKNKAIGNVDDPRMESINQTLHYHCLCVVGFEGFPANDYTRAYKNVGVEFKGYMEKIVARGTDVLNAAEYRFFQQEWTKLSNYTYRNTSVLCGTLTHLGNDVLALAYAMGVTYWIDEAGQASVPDWLNVVTRYKFKQAFLLGDPNQLYPPVVGPSPLTGFMRALEMSPIQLLLDAHWPSVTLTDNRRSAKGIIDIPSDLFYKGLVKAHASSQDDGKHKWTAPIAKLIHETFHAHDVNSAVAYFSSTAPSNVDRLTCSTFNTKNQAFCLNLIEKAIVELGMYPQDIGYTSPYQAQCKRMALGLRKLENEYKSKGSSFAFSLIKCAPIDGYQGGSGKLMIGDYTSSEKLGFMSARGRNCVLLTRAEDFAVYIGNKDIRAPRDETKNYPSMGFAMAGLSNVRHDLNVAHAWMSHRFA